MSSDTTSSSDIVEIAPPPFNDPRADVILRSADNVDFLVHRILLALSSPFFETMFSLPLSSSDSNTRQVINLTEDHRTIEIMLTFCYPFMDTDLRSLENVQVLLEVTKKYDIEAGFKRARKSLVSPVFLDNEPLRVFIIAYRYELEDEAKLAARHICNHPIIMPLIDELKFLPTIAYHRLLEYRSRCGEAVTTLTNSLHWLPANANWVWAACTTCPSGSYRLVLSNGRTWVPRAWFTDYFEHVKDRLRVRPCPKVVLDPALLQPSLEKAYACHFCARKASSELHKYASIVAAKVQKVLSEVNLEIMF